MTLTFVDTPDVMTWGRVQRGPQRVAHPRFVGDLAELARADTGPRLAVGLRRSYGDTALFSAGRLVDMTGLNHAIAFDPGTGLVRAEAGLSLDALLRIMVPRGWFVPVTPGTRQVTLGGALANDVHGKNHHRAGTFGRHVTAFTLLRSDRGVVAVTPQTEPELHAATVGGLGLTGVILDVTLQLKRIASSELVVETLPMGRLADFFALDAESSEGFEHTVAWVDCTRGGDKAGLGFYSRANWAGDGPLTVHQPPRLTIPVETPGFLMNPLSLGVFNRLYRFRQLSGPRVGRQPYSAVFHPLDGIGGWNKLYGRSGFFQYQCVTPRRDAEPALAEMLRLIAKSGQGSALVVLKAFGDLASPGLLSFPRPGYTLALDFQNQGARTLDLLGRLDQVVRGVGGALYPAKDGRMSRAMFELGYPRLAEWLKARDPACGSDFLTRMETLG